MGENCEIFISFITRSIFCVLHNDTCTICTPSYYSPEAFAQIDLTGIAITDNEKNNILLYKFSLSKEQGSELQKGLLDEVGDDLVRSRLFSASASNGRTIYAFISENKGENNLSAFNLNIVTRDNKGRLNLMIDFEILGASQQFLEVVNGPSDGKVGYVVHSNKMLYPF